MSLIKTYVMATLAAILWGANFNLAKPVLAEMSPYLAGASRYTIAAMVMILIARFSQAVIPLREWKAYLTLGIVGVFGFNLFFFLGMAHSSAINGALIMALNPLLTAILSYFILGERPKLVQLLAFPVGIAGVAIVVLGAGAEWTIATGDLYIMIASLNWAAASWLTCSGMPALNI